MNQAAQILSAPPALISHEPVAATTFLHLSGTMTLADIERLVILETLRRRNNNRTHSAKALGIGIRTLQRKLKEYGI